MPTTEEDDVRLIDDGGAGLRDWKERMLVEFRLQRRKGLQQARDSIASEIKVEIVKEEL